jgi:hypothetical protein
MFPLPGDWRRFVLWRREWEISPQRKRESAPSPQNFHGGILADVYLIRNLVNGKTYVGGTRNSVSWVWGWNIRLSKSESANLLQKDIGRYGQNSFEIKILYPNLPLKFLDQMIEYGRAVFKSTDPRSGYNVREASVKSPRPKGRPKIYATNAERKRAYRQRRALREGRNYGQRWSKHKPKMGGSKG